MLTPNNLILNISSVNLFSTHTTFSFLITWNIISIAHCRLPYSPLAVKDDVIVNIGKLQTSARITSFWFSKPQENIGKVHWIQSNLQSIYVCKEIMAVPTSLSSKIISLFFFNYGQTISTPQLETTAQCGFHLNDHTIRFHPQTQKLWLKLELNLTIEIRRP